MSRWAVAKAVHEVSRFEICDFMLDNVCTIFGFPKKLVTDQGSQFMSETFEDLLAIFGVTHLATTAFSPWQNGLTEGFNKDLCRKISKYCNEKQDDWDLYVPLACWWHNTVPNSSTGFSPFEILFGQKPRVPMDHVLDTPVPEDPESIDDYVFARQRQIAEMHDLILTNTDHRAQRAVDRFDSTRRNVVFEVGDLVWLHDHGILKGKVRKFTGKRTGPWKVERVTSETRIKIVWGKSRERDAKTVNPLWLEKYLMRSPEMQEEVRIDEDRRVRYLERMQKLVQPVVKPRGKELKGEGLVFPVEKPWEENSESIYSDDSRIVPPPVPTVQERGPEKRKIVQPDRLRMQAWLTSAQKIQLPVSCIQSEPSSLGLRNLFEC